MDLKEQLKKVLSDQNKLERKKDDFMEEYEEKKKKILLKNRHYLKFQLENLKLLLFYFLTDQLEEDAPELL